MDPLTKVSPSRLEDLRECGYRVFLSSSGGSRGASSPWARLGTVCHEVLEQAARGVLGDGDVDFDQRFEAAWDRSIADQEREASMHDAERYWGAATSWPTYTIKRARVRRRARELAQRVSSWTGAELRIEEMLAPEGELLFGKPDLVVKSPPPYRIEDYKTGAIEEDGQLKDAYRRQLLLYAYLESRMPDCSWPQLAVAVPLSGAPIEIPVTPEAALELADEAATLVASFNSHLEDPLSLARPGVSACGRCPHAARCSAIWPVPEDGFDDLGIIEATVQSIDRVHNGTLSLGVEIEGGTIQVGAAHFYRLSPARIPVVDHLRCGQRIRVVGVSADPDGRSIRPMGWTRAAIVSSDA